MLAGALTVKRVVSFLNCNGFPPRKLNYVASYVFRGFWPPYTIVKNAPPFTIRQIINVSVGILCSDIAKISSLSVEIVSLFKWPPCAVSTALCQDTVYTYDLFCSNVTSRRESTKKFIAASTFLLQRRNFILYQAQG